MRRTVSKVPAYSKHDAYALKALAEGTANESQQKRALKWIIENGCGFREEPFQEDCARKTDFMLGRASVARAITYLLSMPAELLEKSKGDK